MSIDIRGDKSDGAGASYTCDIDHGQGGSETVLADSAADALEWAVEWAGKGDWPAEGCHVLVSVTNDEDEDDAAQEEVEIEALEPESARGCDHEWVGVGGIEENPGCWDTGNGALRLVRVCPHCRTKRVRVESYCGRGHPPGNEGHTRYEPATDAEVAEAERRLAD